MSYSLSPVDLISCSGPDAAAFLHGQLSQNIESLAVGESADAFLLVPDGHLLTTLVVQRMADTEFRLVAPSGTADAAVARLSRFLLRTDCVIEQHDGWQQATVVGTSPESLAREFPADAGLIDELRWPGVEGALVLWAPDAEMPSSLVGASLEPAVVDAARVAGGIAAFGHELAAGQIANEAGPRFVEQHVDFTKGCYVGQELIARVHHRGSNTPQRVVRLTPVEEAASVDSHAAVEVGEQLATGDGVSVTVTTVAGAAALGHAPRKVGDGSTVTAPSGVAFRVGSVE